MLGKPGINGLRAGSTMYGMLSSARFTTTAAGASKVILIDGESAFDEVVKAPKSVVYFTAKWCGPCRKVSPLYDALSEAHGKDLRFAKVDIDAQDELAQSSGINVVPTFQFFEDGKLVKEIHGADVWALTDAVEKAKTT